MIFGYLKETDEYCDYWKFICNLQWLEPSFTHLIDDIVKETKSTSPGHDIVDDNRLEQRFLNIFSHPPFGVR